MGYRNVPLVFYLLVVQFVQDICAYQRKIPKIGEKVAVKSPSKNLFVRAIVSKKVNDTTYFLNYVDYGGIYKIKTSDIFVLPFRFRHLPQSVIKIGINTVWPKEKVNKVSDYFNQLVKLSVPLIVEFDEEDPFGFHNVVLKKESNGVGIYEEICGFPES